MARPWRDSTTAAEDGLSESCLQTIEMLATHPGVFDVALSVFDERQARPTDPELEQALGRAGPAWASLKEQLSREYAPLQEEWAFAGAKFGWSLRLKRGKRVIVYMTPCRDYFLASFALGEKACAAAREAGLPAGILTLIAEAPKYAEGRGVRIPVRTEKEASAIRKLAAIKLTH